MKREVKKSKSLAKKEDGEKNVIDVEIIKKYSKEVNKIKEEMHKIIIGQDRILDSILRAILCNGHILLEGVPGIAKTLMIRALAEVSGALSKRIQFTVDLLPTDITGMTIYAPGKGFEIVKGPIFANFIIADEINRSPPKCVLGDTPIIMENGEIANVKEIIKNYNGKKTYNSGNESWIVPKKPIKLFAFDPSDCKIKPEEVKYLYKQKTSEPYHEIELKSGRKIKTSNIHPFFTLKEGKITTAQAKELREGECVLVPRKIPILGDNKIDYNKKFLKKSRGIIQEIERRKKLYVKVQRHKKEGLVYKQIKEKLKISNKKEENLVKTFMMTKPRYIDYSHKYFFSEAKQFGQVHCVKRPKFVTKEFGQFMAILIAEGSVNGSYFYLTMKEKEIPVLFIKLVQELFDLNPNLLYDKRRKQYRVAFRSDALIDLLRAIGYNPCLKAANKFIPRFISTSKDNVAKEFLRLYYECDGSISRDCIKVTTKSEKIANSLAYLLLRMGFVARIKKEFSKTEVGNYYYKRKFYNLRLYGGELYNFNKKIGFFSEKNKNKLGNLIKNVNRKKTDLIPGMHQSIREFRKAKGLSHKEFYNLIGMHAHNLENKKNALMHSRHRLAKIFKNKEMGFPNIKKLIYGDFYCDFVKRNNLVIPKKEYWLYDFSMKNKHSFIAGFGGIISHNTQSALLEAMQEKQVTIGKETFKLPLPFFVMANENPLETSGVYLLPEAQIDRFLFKILIDYPLPNEEIIIMKENINLKKFEDFGLKKVVDAQKLIEIQNLVKKVYINKAIEKYIINIVSMTRSKKSFENAKFIEWGSSPRASIGLFIASKAQAFMKGRNFVTPQDVKDVAHDVLRHRFILKYEATAENITSDKIIDNILNKIKVP